MISRPEYFGLHELVCPHVFFKYGESAWQFRDQKQLDNIDWVRVRLGPTFINNWYDDFRDSDYIKEIERQVKAKGRININNLPPVPKDLLSQRGLRCNLCNLSLDKVEAGIIYVSPHLTGQGDDYHVQGMIAEEVRQFLIKNQAKVPHSFRLEKGVSWVHMDSRDTDKKLYLFNA